MSLVNYSSAAEHQAFYAASPAPSKHGLVLLQEWWGLNSDIKDLAVKFSLENIHTLSPDLYHGRVASTPDESEHLMKGLDWKAAMEEICLAAKYLREKIGCSTVGVAGFCMGGALSVASSIRDDKIFDFAIPFYGIPPKEHVNPSLTKIPVQAHFGRLDKHVGFTDVPSVNAYEQDLKNSGVKYELHWYDAGHGFMNKSCPSSFQKESADLAFSRAIAFLKSH